MFANRITKSKIQLISEALQYKNEFKESINELTDKFNVEDAVFVMNNGLKEATVGYFAYKEVYESLDEAMSNMDLSQGMNAVRVINNNLYQVGTIFERLSECAEDLSVVDLSTLKDVR